MALVIKNNLVINPSINKKESNKINRTENLKNAKDIRKSSRNDEHNDFNAPEKNTNASKIDKNIVENMDKNRITENVKLENNSNQNVNNPNYFSEHNNNINSNNNNNSSVNSIINSINNATSNTQNPNKSFKKSSTINFNKENNNISTLNIPSNQRRKSSKKVPLINIKKTAVIKKNIKDFMITCIKCEEDIYLKEIFTHFEKDCEKFVSQMGSVVSKAPKSKIFKIGKIIINKVQNYNTENPDPDYQSKIVQEDIVLSLSNNSMKDFKLGNKLTNLWKIDVKNMSTGNVPLKSYQFLTFSYLDKKRNTSSHYIAYKVDPFSVYIADIQESKIKVILNKHTDHISELRNLRIKDSSYFVTCSYDGTAIFWNLPNFIPQFELKFQTWVNSICMGSYINDDLIFCACGFSKSSFIGVFNTSGKHEFNINFSEDFSPILIETYNRNKINYLFVGTDATNPKIIVIDYYNKSFVKIFEMADQVTCMMSIWLESDKTILYASDLSGNISEFDINNLRELFSYSAGKRITDFCNYDGINFFIVGNKGNIYVSLRHKHKQVKIYHNIHEKTIVNIQKIYLKGSGTCIATLSSDNTIKLLKTGQTY